MPPSSLVAVAAADGPLGARVVARLGGTEDDVLALAWGELGDPELKRRLEGARAAVVDAAATMEPLAGTRAALDALAAGSPEVVVVVTSALVYGAWPTNPVPLTEDAALRPNAGFAPAVALGEVERLVADWADAHPAVRVVVLRPAASVAEEADGWLPSLLAAARRQPSADAAALPPAQFVHLDDVVSAVQVALAGDLRGPVNVAPEGWLGGDEVLALTGRPPLRLPGDLGQRAATLRWRAGLSPAPPGLLPWTLHPWVVASDRLRAAGWRAEHTNAEAFVAGHRASPLATLTAGRRQQLALGGAAVAATAVVAGGTALARRLLRRR